MLMSVIMSAPGPLIVGAGLIAGKSTTQLADFIRRSAELMAIIVSFITYELTGKKEWSREKRLLNEKRSNAFVGLAMLLSGVIMLCITLFSKSKETGNVIPGLAVALLGVAANTIFWQKYKILGRKQNNSILLVQSRLYRAKSLVDLCVTTALTAVLLFPGTSLAVNLDKVGSAVVSLYLVCCAAKTLKEAGEGPLAKRE